MCKFYFNSVILAFFIVTSVTGQGIVESPLFQTLEPLPLKVSGSIKYTKGNSNDSTYITNQVFFQHPDGRQDSLQYNAKVRGNFRLKTCYFSPLKIQLKPKNAKDTPFAGNKNLKLVLPCQNTSDKNRLILKEYLCYRFYELITPFYFKTRLTAIALTETSKKKPRSYELLGFFVEDNQKVAERNGGKVMKELKLHPKYFDDLNTIRHDFFQFMIGNVDWSSSFQHNSNILKISPAKYVPLAYDFDMAGFVNAAYARENAPAMSNGDIKSRIYRGYCREKSLMKSVREEYIKLEPSIFSLLDNYKEEFPKSEFSEMRQYLEQFFKILNNDTAFESQILNSCRTDQ